MSHSPKRALTSGLLHGMSKCVLATAAAASMLLTLGVTTANAAEGAPASTVTKDQLQTLVTESKKIDQNTKTVPTAEALAAALKTADATLAPRQPDMVLERFQRQRHSGSHDHRFDELRHQVVERTH